MQQSIIQEALSAVSIESEWPHTLFSYKISCHPYKKNCYKSCVTSTIFPPFITIQNYEPFVIFMEKNLLPDKLTFDKL